MMRWMALPLALASLAPASDDKTDRGTLKGIKTVCTVVEVTDQSHGISSGLKKDQLQSDVQTRLRKAGIEIDKNATACLYLHIRPLPAIGKNNKPIGLYAVDFTLEFLQAVTLARDPKTKAYASTWSIANLATVPVVDMQQSSREIVADLVEQFVKAYRSVNP